jgi:hypothetical protein
MADDYPYVYPEGPVRPVESGGTRLRVFRKRPQREGTENEQESSTDPHAAAWRELLEKAVAELNEGFQETGAPYACQLLEDDAGFLLRVARGAQEGEVPGSSEKVEEILQPADLPAWLARLRAHLGILVDEKA